MMIILLCDDTEVRGNGNGSVKDLIYTPVSRYVDALIENNIRATFFVDMAHYIYLNEHEKNSEDFTFFKKALLLLFRNNMDVQLHLHSQWLSRIANPSERVDLRWNIGMLSREEIAFLVSKGKELLQEIGRTFDKNYNVHAFKAGSWGIEPMDKVCDILVSNGIDLIIGPSGNIKIDYLNLDYSSLRGEFGILKVGNSNIALMTEVGHSVFDMLCLMFKRITLPRRHVSQRNFASVGNPLKDASLFYRIGFQWVTHLRMNWQSPKYIVRLVKRLANSSKKIPYVYIETHTKDFREDQINSPSYLLDNLKEFNCNFLTVTELRNDFITNT